MASRPLNRARHPAVNRRSHAMPSDHFTATQPRARALRCLATVGLIACAFLLFSPPLPAAPPAPAPATNAPATKPPQEKFAWPAWTIPAAPVKSGGDLNFVADPAAQSQRPSKNDDGRDITENSALQLRVNRREIVRAPLAIATTPVVPWTNVVPGVYRVTARLKYAGDSQSIGTPIVLGVTASSSNRTEKSEQSFHSFDLNEPEVALLFEADPTLAKKPPARRPRHAWHHAEFLPEIYPNATNRPAAAPPLVSKPPHGLQISLALPRTATTSAPGFRPIPSAPSRSIGFAASASRPRPA